MQEFLERTKALGLLDRVNYLGPIMRRAEMLKVAQEADIGLAFMPLNSDDLNMTKMVGASNKPFDYLAVGMMLLVSDLPDWKAMYVEPGYGLACDPANVERLAQTIAWCEANRDRARAMGEAGRQRVLAEWNYEHQSAPVVRRLQAQVLR